MFNSEPAVNRLLSLMPDKTGRFSGSEYPLPVHSAFFTGSFPDAPVLSGKLKAVVGADAKPYLDPILLCAEAVESVQPDRDKYFIPDRKVQNYVFMGSKWRAGWALVLGGEESGPLIEELKKREFMVFTDLPGIPDTWDIGQRDTCPVYFLQMMVRYGLVWGRIKPGDDHQMGHYLEKDMPGLVIIRKDLSPLKYLVTLGLMKLGAPALVPSSFPFPYGTRKVADTDQAVLNQVSGFENLRTREYSGELLSLPAYANIAFANQEFPAAGSLGNTPLSFFCLRPAPAGPGGADPGLQSDSGDDLGILIEVKEKDFSTDISLVVERAAFRALNFTDGWKAREDNGSFSLEWAAHALFEPERAKEIIRAGLRLQYPGLKDFTVRIIRDHARLAELAPEITRFKTERQRLLDSMTEATTPLFGVCTECRPFSLVHTCIITPDRTPMCAARSYFTVKAACFFGSDQRPFKRRTEGDVPLRFMFDRGRILDAQRGEYEGANEIYRTMTRGALSRVRLHSLDEVPHTSCGCFQNLAFRIRGHGGIGIMKRGSNAVTPDGRSWEMLANYAGGKQSDGIMGVSNQYVGSPDFLRGDGGMAAVVWVDSDIYGRIKRKLAQGQKVATEKEVRTVEELKAFLAVDSYLNNINRC